MALMPTAKTLLLWGSFVQSNSDHSVAIGTAVTTNKNDSIGIGHGVTTKDKNSIGIGNGVVNNQNNSIGIGNGVVTNFNTVAIGNGVATNSNDGIAIGNGVTTNGSSSVAMGYGISADGVKTVAIGTSVKAKGVSSIVVGRDTTVNGDGTTVIGANNGVVDAGQSAVVGYNNKVSADIEQLIFGSNSETSGQGSIVVGTHTKATAIDAVGIGNNAIADKPNGVAIGTNSVTDDAVAVAGMTVNGKTHTVSGSSPNAVASFGAKDRAGFGGVTNYTRQLTNVAAGQVNADSTDAVNGSQLFAVAEEVGNNGTVINNHTTQINTLNQGVATNSVDIRALERTADNHEHRITDLENRSNEVGNEIHATNERMNHLGASSAALSGLHPLDFNRSDKASYAVSYGHYRNANAVALGAFYRPNERVMVGVGASLGAEKMYTANVAFKFGKGSDYVQEAKDKDSRISKLETLVHQLMEQVQANGINNK